MSITAAVLACACVIASNPLTPASADTTASNLTREEIAGWRAGPTLVILNTTWRFFAYDRFNKLWLHARKPIRVSFSCLGFFVSSDGYIASSGECTDWTQARLYVLTRVAHVVVADHYYKQKLTVAQVYGISKADYRLVHPKQTSLKAYDAVALRTSGHGKAARVVVSAAPTDDVSLLKVDARHTPALLLDSQSNVRDGEQVFTLDWPANTTQQTVLQVRRGKAIGRKRLPGHRLPVFAIRNAIHNRSGGPVLDDTGAVIGISTLVGESQRDVVRDVGILRGEMARAGVKNSRDEVRREYIVGLNALLAKRRGEALKDFDAVLAASPSNQYARGLKQLALALPESAAGGGAAGDGGSTARVLARDLLALVLPIIALIIFVWRRRRGRKVVVGEGGGPPPAVAAGAPANNLLASAAAVDDRPYAASHSLAPSPHHPLPAETFDAEMPSSTFMPLERRSRLAVVLLLGGMVVGVVAIWFDLWEIRAIDRYQAGTDAATGALASSDQRQTAIRWIQALMYLGTALAFLRWFHAAYRNIAALHGLRRRFGSKWAIGAWFVPVLNLWRPRQIAEEIWRASVPEAPLLLTYWWVCWVISFLIANYSSRNLLTANTLPDFRDSDKLDIVSLAIQIAAAVLAILFIQRITRAQLEHAVRLGVADSATAGTGALVTGEATSSVAASASSAGLGGDARSPSVAEAAATPMPAAQTRLTAVPRVIFQSPDGEDGLEIPIVRKMVIGREHSDILVADDEVSRHHAVIGPSGSDALEITDLNSTNGTRVNGVRIERAILRDGDIIALGRTTLRVSLSAPRD